jgi:GMP synthase (glutamine-hydrolysing)
VDSIAVLDFGSQYSQLIARRVRELNVYCELFPYSTPAETVRSLAPRGYILSGGPASIYAPDAPYVPEYVLKSGRPVLGICYGMQALAYRLGGKVAPSHLREYGQATIQVRGENPLLPVGALSVWMSHGDRIERLPEGFRVLAISENSPVAAMGDGQRGYYCVQFHPEVRHTERGKQILRAFVIDICGAQPDWTPESIVETAVNQVKGLVGEAHVIAGVSGGVDSTVAAAIVHRAVGDQLTCIFINPGLLRQGEPESVIRAFGDVIHAPLVALDATETFLDALRGVVDPEEKRRVIGEVFIRIFEAQAARLGEARFLVQGTIYPDVVESSGPDRQGAARIKTHHNVGGLPEEMSFELVEPLRYLFKDEVREAGLALGLPEELVWRQPFPGPGLAVRCLGEVTQERLQRLRAADAIVRQELSGADMLRGETAQAFAVLLPVRSVGVMGDNRTYGETVVVRAVTTEDFMTADWARIPPEILGAISTRIVNEVPGVNRVAYDITSKPPATIEWARQNEALPPFRAGGPAGGRLKRYSRVFSGSSRPATLEGETDVAADIRTYSVASPE